MKKIVLIIFLFTHVFLTFSSPDKANWKRIIFIGHNDSCYFYYQLERIQPGSDFFYTEKLTLIKQSLQTDSIVEIINIRETEFNINPMDLVQVSKRHFSKTEKIQDPINTEKYLLLENVSYQFNSIECDSQNAKNLILSKEGLIYINEDKITQILSSIAIETKIKGFQNMFNSESNMPRYIDYYEDGLYCFFIIEYGVDCYDIDMIQTIFRIETNEFEKKIKR